MFPLKPTQPASPPSIYSNQQQPLQPPHQPQPLHQPQPPYVSNPQVYYAPPVPQPQIQTNPCAVPHTGNIIYGPPILVQRQDPPVDDSNRTCFFVLGFILAILINVFAFLFFACSSGVGVVGKRKLPFLTGTIIGVIINTTALVVVFWLLRSDI